jgi:hypothetical protein
MPGWRLIAVMAAVFTLFSVVVESSNASSVTVRGGSNYGGSADGFLACANGTTGAFCEDFDSTAVGTVLVDVDGTDITAEIYQYVYGSGTTAGTTLDIIGFGSAGTSLIETDSSSSPGSTFSFGTVTPLGSVPLPSLFDPSTIEVFSCGQSGSGQQYSHTNDSSDMTAGGGSVLYDSGATEMSTTCTQQLTSAPNITFNSATGSFTATDLSLQSGDLVLDASNVGLVTAPEPSSLMLFGVGLFGLIVFALKAR